MNAPSPSYQFDVPVPQERPLWLDLVEQRVTGLKFGLVQIAVHDGRVTQVEFTEKLRFEPTAASRESPPTAPVRRRAPR